MPLLRFEVRNEYGLGQPELYKQADREDPKAVLDGVAVTGLVGILRQLGDLAEFASEVFHGLQEQVMTTASRSHKLAVRVEHIEASLPPLEKAVLAQTSHIHFAYTASTQWHPRIHNEQNHFIYNDLPRFIMDSYEECRHPPRLHALDKFDAGGPGSCLKRYSDPTFFKRISGSYTEAISEKIQREKKPRRSKKKKSSRRNGELSRVASMPVHRGRMPSPVVHERTFSQTSSVVDMKYRSDLVSDSFDSRTGSGFIECDFNQSSSLQYGEQDSRHSSSRFMPHIDNREATFSDESTQLVDKRTLSAPSKEHIAPTSSCVSWDEKAEIVESMGQQSDRDDTPELVFSMNQQSDRDDAPELVLSMGQQSDRDDAPELVSADFDIDMQDKRAANFRNIDESPEVLSANVDQDTQDGRHANFRNIDEAQEALSANYDLDSQDSKAANFRNIDRMDIQLADEDTPKSVSNRNQLDENESETDYYMDALNTIESESENDLDCQTKREVEPDSSVVNNSKAEHEIDGSVTHSSDYCSPNIDSNSVTTGMSPPTVPDPVPSESITLEPIPQTFLKSCDSDHSLNADVCKSAEIVDVPKVESAISHGLKVESVICDPSSSGSRVSELPDQSDNKNTSSVHESQDSHTENSCSQPVKLWTNGGLLGLEPSKPPVFTASNGTSRDQIDRSNGEMVGPHNLSDVQKVTPDILDYNAERSEKVSSCGIKKIPLLSFGLESKSENSAANTSDHNGQDGLNVSAGAASKTEFAPEVKATSAEASRENDGNSSLVFGLGHRLLVNGFHRKSLEHDERSEPVRHLYPDVSGQWSRQHHETQREISDNAFIEKLERGSPLGSPTSSPPLEHMKISFNPADGFEMSKLKLKFPDGSHYQESIRDAFPSFQLIPEPTSPLYNHDSDSDDDTFCRSSPYMSDDHPSHQSDSNSEEWESGGSPRGSTENELYDALSRMSSIGSVSSSLLVNRTRKDMFVDRGLQNIYNDNDAEPKLSVLDLPSFDTMNPVMLKVTKAISDPTLKLGENKEDTPLPPPLPPVQWRVPKAQSDVAEDQQQDRSEAFKDALERKRANLRTINKDFLEAKQENKVDQQKFNGQKETSKNANGVGMDEKEDFLHQIRMKSFSLRPTVQARPTFTPGPATNTKVTAILEKATAIRQAVGSDTGEDDDNWSDA